MQCSAVVKISRRKEDKCEVFTFIYLIACKKTQSVSWLEVENKVPTVQQLAESANYSPSSMKLHITSLINVLTNFSIRIKRFM